MREECEGYVIRHRVTRRASVCVHWTRRPNGVEILEIIHKHLCGSCANLMCNGYDRGDTWTEQPLDVCARETIRSPAPANEVRG